MREIVVFGSGVAAGLCLAVVLRHLKRKSSRVWLVVNFDVKDEVAWRDAMLPLVEATLAEPGNCRYVLHRPCHPVGSLAAPDTGRYTLIEEFESQSAVDAHNLSKHFTENVPQLAKAANIQVTRLTPL